MKKKRKETFPLTFLEFISGKERLSTVRSVTTMLSFSLSTSLRSKAYINDQSFNSRYLDTGLCCKLWLLWAMCNCFDSILSWYWVKDWIDATVQKKKLIDGIYLWFTIQSFPPGNKSRDSRITVYFYWYSCVDWVFV